MTNIITHDFYTHEEFHPKTILRSTITSLNNDVLNHIYSYLIPDCIDFTRHINIVYTEKIHDQMMYRTRCIVLNYYDFVFQLARQLWFNDSMSKTIVDDHIFPHYRQHSLCFRKSQIKHPTHFAVIENNLIFWMKLFVELAIDFRFHDVYLCNSEYHLMKNINTMEDKYISWFKLNQNNVYRSIGP